MPDRGNSPPEADNQTKQTVEETLKRLQGKSGTEVDEILKEEIQKEMKEHPYSPGQISAFVKELSQKLQESKNLQAAGTLPKVDIKFDAQSGHVVVKDDNTHKTLDVGATTSKETDNSTDKHGESKTEDKAEKSSEKHHKRDYSKLLDIKGASPEFVERIKTNMDKMPPEILDKLQKHGTKIVVAGKMADYDANLAKEQPRGWPAGSTWSNVEGMFEDNTNRVVICETSMHKGKEVKTDPERTQYALFHESSHAVDHAMGNYSHGHDFTQAYNEDLKHMSAADRQRLSYLLQGENDPKDFAGREEAFGDILAVVQGGKWDAQDVESIRRAFPRTYVELWTRFHQLERTGQ